MPSVHAIMQAGNLYVYVMHNPVMFTDPSGLSGVNPMLQWIAQQLAANPEFRDAAVVVVRHIPGAAGDSVTFEFAFGAGYGRSFSLGPVRGEWEAALRQIHSFSNANGYEQSNQIGGDLAFHLWRDLLGIRAGGSYGVAYNSRYGYGFDDNFRIVPVTELTARAFVGESSAGWGTDLRDSDWIFAVGAGKYLGVGGEVEIRFNLNEFDSQMRRRLGL